MALHERSTKKISFERQDYRISFMDLKVSMTSRLICDLGHNKMEQQSPIPQIQDEAAQRAKTRHFPIFDFRGRRGLGFPFILSNFAIVDGIELNSQPYPPPPPPYSLFPQIKDEDARRAKTRHFPIFDFWGSGVGV